MGDRQAHAEGYDGREFTNPCPLESGTDQRILGLVNQPRQINRPWPSGDAPAVLRNSDRSQG